MLLAPAQAIELRVPGLTNRTAAARSTRVSMSVPSSRPADRDVLVVAVHVGSSAREIGYG